MNWPSKFEIENYIRDQILGEIYSLGIKTEWIGDPSTSEFGIKINLTYHDNPIGDPTVVSFIGKTC